MSKQRGFWKNSPEILKVIQFFQQVINNVIQRPCENIKSIMAPKNKCKYILIYYRLHVNNIGKREVF